MQPVGKLTFSVEQVGALFEDAFEQIWRGNAENDGFNRLVLGAKLDWRQVAMLRGYCKYLLQTGATFSQAYMEETLNRYPAIAGLLVELFLAKFDPRREALSAEQLKAAGATLAAEMQALIPANVQGAHPTLIDGLSAALSEPRDEQVQIVESAIGVLLENVASLDEDRILRSFVALIRGHPAHQLLPAVGRRLSPTTSATSSIRTRCRSCPSRYRIARSGCAHRASRASICASARWRVAACAGPIDARISAPRCWAWSRRRW